MLCQQQRPLSKILQKIRFSKPDAVITGGTLVDIGCGADGKLLKHFSNRIKIAYGFDREVPVGGVEFGNYKLFHIDDLNNGIPLDDNTADYVTLLAVLEHMENPEFVLSEICRILKPGGKLILTVPTWFGKPILWFFTFVLRVTAVEGYTDHKRYYNRTQLRESLQSVFGRKNIDTLKHFELRCNLFAVARKD